MSLTNDRNVAPLPTFFRSPCTPQPGAPGPWPEKGAPGQRQRWAREPRGRGGERIAPF